jgi:hypothetical protein
MELEAFFKCMNTAFKRSFLDAAAWEGRFIAEGYKSTLVKNVKAQKYKEGGGGFAEWKPLNRAYAARKEKLGLDNRMLIATGKYLEEISVRLPRVDGEKVTYIVEPSKKTVIGQNTADFTYGWLSVVLERGSVSRNIPPRPHWGPTGAEFANRRSEFAEKLQRRFIKDFDNRIKDCLSR